MPHATSASTDMSSTFKTSPRPLPLSCGIQSYAWGQSGPDAFIPRLLGRPPEYGKTYAEWWIGDHPALPARVLLEEGEADLPALIRSSPEAVLGAVSRGRFGDRLPFLMKILAVSKALSIQAHPGKKQAEEGFAREEAAGVPLGAPHRNYKDDNHKPELLAALTPFWGLKGFRPIEEIAAALEVEAPELRGLMPDFRARLAKASAPADRAGLLAALYRAAMTLPQAEVDKTLAPLLARLRKSGDFPIDRREHWLLRAERDHCPGPLKDRGLFSFYFLNLVHLAPGQALFLEAGELHAYLEGVGVEVMANSDNVLRGGLTPKHVDIPELLRALTFRTGAPEALSPDAGGVYRTPAEEFEAAKAVLPAGGLLRRPAARGAEVWLAIEGAGELRASGGGTPLRSGVPMLMPSALGAYEVFSPDGITLFRVSAP